MLRSKDASASGLGAVALATMLALASSGCRTAAPERITVGACTFHAAEHLGALPFWEGPDQTLGGDRVISPRSLVVTSSHGFDSMAAEVYTDGKRLARASRTYRGSVSVLASNGDGPSIFFVRPVSEVGGEERFDLERDTLAQADLRRGGEFTTLPVSAWQPRSGGSLTTICADPASSGGGLWAWMDDAAGSGVSPRRVSGPVPAATAAGAPPTDTPTVEASAPVRCASDEVCSSTLFARPTGPDEIRTHCSGKGPNHDRHRSQREPADHHWMSSSVVHPRGTVADFESIHRKSTIRVRLNGDTTRTFALPGVVYAVTFRDERTLLAHVVEGAAEEPAHVAVVVIDAARGPTGRMDLDFARGPIDRKGRPNISLLPETGNGRPLLVALDDAMVLITGPGDIWAWRREGGAAGCGSSAAGP